MSAMMVKELELIEQFRDMSLVCELTPQSVMLGMLNINSDFLDSIKEAHKLDVKLVDLMIVSKKIEGGDFKVDEQGVLRFRDRICIPDDSQMKKMILEESHRSSLSIHPEVESRASETGEINETVRDSIMEINISFPVPKLADIYVRADGQMKSTIQSLEDLLRACVLEQGGLWDNYLPLIEFTYNNSFHSSIGMAPFEALYGQKCRTPLCWYESGESVVLKPEIVQQTTEKVKLIREKMKTLQSRQKSYHDKRRKDLEFE
ncbi:uncharacterized protein LOC131634367 [Vicia villosa]|uniref:uncharacterized protein LOC131634367 n=1 Tax=Vicia villosa TaxID=3911 RepID=UPI00273BA995|nr:uncharacterized protein LOC131634367 [Vicia villosa]